MAQIVVESRRQNPHFYVAVLHGTCEQEKKNGKDIKLRMAVYVVGL